MHGRNEGRSRDALAEAPGARGVVTGDLATIAGATTVADEVNKLGRFDAVIHNAGVGYREGRVETEPGVRTVFAVNVLAVFPRSQRLCHRIDRHTGKHDEIMDPAISKPYQALAHWQATKRH